MTNEESIRKQVDLLRKGYSIGIYPYHIPLLCNECDEENLKFTIINNFFTIYFINKNIFICENFSQKIYYK